MKKINLKITIAILFAAISFSGCGQSTETTTSNTNTANRMTANVANTTVNSVNSMTPNSNTLAVNSATSNVSNADPAVKSKQSPAKMPTPNVGSGGNDVSILMNARSAISNDKDLVNSVIVEVKEGNVTLNGKVSNEAQKQKAEQIVRGVQGIKSIKNNLRVGA